MSNLERIKQELTELSTKELEAKLDLYKDLKSRSVNDEIMITLFENEMERRFLAWEAA